MVKRKDKCPSSHDITPFNVFHDKKNSNDNNDFNDDNISVYTNEVSDVGFH